MKREIKAIIFDIGGVLFEESTENIYPELIKKFKLDKNDFYDIRKKYNKQAIIGKLKRSEYSKSVGRDLRIKDTKRFLNFWNQLRKKYVKIDKKMELTLKKLKNKYILATITNTTLENEKARKTNNIYKYFKIKLISCKLGFKKPQLRIYRLSIKKLKVSPEEILFIDDAKKNIASAQLLGMKTILFKNNTDFLKKLEKFNIKV